MVIVIGGMIGLGKTSVANVLGEHFKSEVFYESVDDNPILPLFYTSSEEEIEKKRYPFLLQLHFLNSRFKSIKEALSNDYNVLDRSIYEDWYFAKTNKNLGRISDLEFNIYESLLNNMMQELDDMPKKSPDLMIYLKGSFDTVLKRIQKRGREYELDDDLKDYYYTLWKDYDNWVFSCYKASKVLVIDMDKIDIVNNKEDRDFLIKQVENVLDLNIHHYRFPIKNDSPVSIINYIKKSLNNTKTDFIVVVPSKYLEGFEKEYNIENFYNFRYYMDDKLGMVVFSEYSDCICIIPKKQSIECTRKR